MDRAFDHVFYVDRTFYIREFTDIGCVGRAGRFCTHRDTIA